MRLGVAGVTVDSGGRGEFRSILCKLRGCVYGATWKWLPVVIRRLGVRGELGESAVLAANVKIRGNDCSGPADCGGVNVNEAAVSLASSSRSAVMGVRFELGNAELGVSGYAIENGPGVWVRCDG